MSRSIVLLLSSMETGGTERVAAGLVNAWAERGDVVTLVITFSQPSTCFYPLHPAIRVVYLYQEVRHREPQGMLGRIARLRALRRVIANCGANLIVSFLAEVNIATLVASLGLHIPVIVSERSYPPRVPQSSLVNAARRCTYPLADRVVMLSQEGMRWLETSVPGARGAVIPNAAVYPLPRADPYLAPASVLPEGRKLLLAVGRLDRGKQFDVVVRAFSRVAVEHPDWDLVILGDGPERGALAQHIHSHDLAGRAFLPGRAGNMGEWYERADLYVMASQYEGFPNTLVEAMSHGLAVISYDCDTGPRDIIRDGIDGLLLRPVGDQAVLTQALLRLVSNESERRAMASQALDIRHRYATDRILRMWDNLFDEVVERTNAAR